MIYPLISIHCQILLQKSIKQNSMSDSYIQNLFAERIGGANYGKSTAIYKFEKIKRAKRAASKAKPDVALIDMGVGEPDDKAFPQVIEALAREAQKLENRGYADNGCTEFKVAAAQYMEKVFGVKLDPETQVLHSIGSKAAASILPAVFINKGDVVVMTVPGYPVFGTHVKYYGGEVYNLQLRAENHFLPDLKEIPEDILKRTKIIVVNYPNNPTGASATLEFFKELVDFAKKHNIIVVSDAAYASLTFDEEPISILQVEGAVDVAVEMHSLSKSHNMTGWRIGWVCGNPLIVKAYGDVKDNTDSGQFLAIQKAAIEAMADPSITRDIAKKYSRRMDLLVEALKASGFTMKKPKAGFFLYARAPKSATLPSGERIEFKTGEDFSQWLISEHLISTVPWDDAGPFVRFSVTFVAPTQEDEKKVIEEIKRRIGTCKFEF